MASVAFPVSASALRDHVGRPLPAVAASLAGQFFAAYIIYVTYCYLLHRWDISVIRVNNSRLEPKYLGPSQNLARSCSAGCIDADVIFAISEAST